MKAELSNIDSMIFSTMKKIVKDKLGTKYGLTDDNFSTVHNEPTSATFPFVFFTRVGGYEIGEDLEGDMLRGANLTYQIRVFDNISQYRTNEVSNAVVKAFKMMSFKCTSLPIFVENGSTNEQIIRFSRKIEQGDTI